MFALLAAAVFLVDLIFKPATDVNLVVVGLLFISLHLAVGNVLPFLAPPPVETSPDTGEIA